MAKKTATVVVTLRDRATRGLRSLSNGVGRLAKRFGVVAAAATAVAGVVGVRFFAGAIRSAGDFDEAMQTVGVVTGATAEELERLRATADEAGTTTRFTATEAAQGLEELARSGQNAGEAIATLAPVLDLAAGNNQTVAESALQVTTALNAFGLSAEDAARVSDVYTRAAQRSAQTTAQLGEAMTFVAPVARQAGLTVETTAALVGKLADSGFRASLGGTALRNALLQFQDPASNFRAELSKLGIETDDFVEALAGLSGAGDNAEAAIRALGLRAGPAIQAVVASGTPALREFQGELDNATGATNEAARAMENNLPGALRSLASAFDGARRRLVEPLVEKITSDVQAFAGTISQFVTSGQLDGLATAISDAFAAGSRAVQSFLQQVNFTAVTERLRAFVDTAGVKLGEFRVSAESFGRTFGRITGGIQTFVGALGTLFNATGVIISKALELATGAIGKFAGLLNTFSLGTIDVLKTIRDEAKAFQLSIAESTAEFEAKVGASTARMVEGWGKLTDTAEQAAGRMERAAARSGQAVDQQLTEPVKRAEENLGAMQQALLAAGLTMEQLGLTAATTGEQIEESSEGAADGIKRIGDEAEATVPKIERIFPLDAGLNLVGDAADDAARQFETLGMQIERATTTTQLDALTMRVEALAGQGALTEDQVRALVDAIQQQAAAMSDAAANTDRNTEAVERLGGTAASTGAALESMGNKARGASMGAKGMAGTFGAVLDSWRELGPEANAEVERFIEEWNRMPLASFQGFSSRLARFTENMERRFGDLRDQQRTYQNDLSETERRTGSLADATDRLAHSHSSLSGSEITQRIIVEFRRDQGEQLVLSNSQIDRIVDRVLSQIEGDQGRTG